MKYELNIIWDFLIVILNLSDKSQFTHCRDFHFFCFSKGKLPIEQQIQQMKRKNVLSLVMAKTRNQISLNIHLLV